MKIVINVTNCYKNGGRTVDIYVADTKVKCGAGAISTGKAFDRILRIRNSIIWAVLYVVVQIIKDYFSNPP